MSTLLRGAHVRIPPLATAAGLLLMLIAAPRSYGQVQIAQVDPSRLLTEQRVDVYVSATDANGHPIRGLGPTDFALSEAVPGGAFLPVQRFTFREGVNTRDGVAFYLLVDNSGSMYFRLAPPATAAAPSTAAIESTRPQTRMAAAQAAIRTFLNSVTNPADRIGLAVFNSYFRPEVLPTTSRLPVEQALARITRPAPAAAFTELYASLESAAHDLAGWKGRKVIILLTDGQNYPYYVNTGKPSPQFGTKIVSSADAVNALIRQGISVFPIHVGPSELDAKLGTIARQTGGRLFQADNERELAKVYLDVRARVSSEYVLSYSPRMLPGDRRLVRVDYAGPGGPASASRLYFVGTLFGGTPGKVSPILLGPFLLALVGWFLLSRLRFLNRSLAPNLEVLGSGRTRVFPLKDEPTIVHVGEDDNVTVATQREGPRAPGDITIAKDPVAGAFTVESAEPVMVNNQPRRRRVLEPGDVLRIGDTTVIFDVDQEQGDPASQPAGGRGKSEPEETAARRRKPAGQETPQASGGRARLDREGD